MATGGGNRNGTHKLPNLRNSASFKSKLPPANVRRSVGAVSGADSGELCLLLVVCPLFYFQRDLITLGVVEAASDYFQLYLIVSAGDQFPFRARFKFQFAE